MGTHKSPDLFGAPLEECSIAQLTDALGIKASAQLLGVTERSIYTVRNSNHLGIERIKKLIAAIRADETGCRERLAILYAQRKRHAEKRATQTQPRQVAQQEQ